MKEPITYSCVDELGNGCEGISKGSLWDLGDYKNANSGKKNVPTTSGC